jgi:hypothetical protein
MPSTRRSALVAMALVALTAAPANARPQLAKPQYVARADRICSTAIGQTHALGTVTTLAAWGGAAGARLLAIDHTALTGLTALTPPPADAVTLRRLTAGARATVDETARAIAAARSGDAASFRAHAAIVTTLTHRYQAGARAYGFHVCQRWGS